MGPASPQFPTRQGVLHLKSLAGRRGVANSVRGTTSRAAKPLSQERMVPRRLRKVLVLAGLATEAQAPIIVANKTKPSPTTCAAISQPSHGACLRSWRLLAPPSLSPLTLASNLVFGHQVGREHCRQISTELMFRNVLVAHVNRRFRNWSKPTRPSDGPQWHQRSAATVPARLFAI
jgi:hypothetical protein